MESLYPLAVNRRWFPVAFLLMPLSDSKLPFICDPTPRNESLCAFEKREKNGKSKKKIFFCLVYMMCFVKIDQLRYPDMTTALQTCYNINTDWHTFFLEADCFSFVLRVISFSHNGRVSSNFNRSILIR
jgi:hypothetical protein